MNISELKKQATLIATNVINDKLSIIEASRELVKIRYNLNAEKTVCLMYL